MKIKQNFRAFNFSLIYHRKYGFFGAYKKYKKQREELNRIREKLNSFFKKK